MKKILFGLTAAAAVFGATSSALAEDPTNPTAEGGTQNGTIITGKITGVETVEAKCIGERSHCSAKTNSVSGDFSSYTANCDFSGNNNFCIVTFQKNEGTSYCLLGITKSNGTEGPTYSAMLTPIKNTSCEFKDYEGGASVSSATFDIAIKAEPGPASE